MANYWSSDMLAYQQTYATTANAAIPIYLNGPQPAAPVKEGPLEWLRRQVDEITDLAAA